MLPPGLSFNAISEKARRAQASAKLPRAYWDWEKMLKQNADRFLSIYSAYHSSLWPSRSSNDV